MRIYTRSGDDGTTGLFDGSRASKHVLRIDSYGTVDEANCCLGHAARLSVDPIRHRLLVIQNQLFDLGADLATPARESAVTARVPCLGAEHIATLERWIDESESSLPPLHTFVLPGGSELACWLHTARTVVRRAERLIVKLAETEPVNPDVLKYVNRLSDLLFSWSRLANHLAGMPDVLWQKNTTEANG